MRVEPQGRVDVAARLIERPRVLAVRGGPHVSLGAIGLLREFINSLQAFFRAPGANQRPPQRQLEATSSGCKAARGVSSDTAWAGRPWRT